MHQMALKQHLVTHSVQAVKQLLLSHPPTFWGELSVHLVWREITLSATKTGFRPELEMNTLSQRSLLICPQL